MMSVIVKEDNKEICYVKGAPERILERCNYIYEDSMVKPLTFQKKKVNRKQFRSHVFKSIKMYRSCI